MELDVDNRKRKRLSSGGSTLTSQFVTDHLECYGELVLHCTVKITYNIRQLGNSLVLKYVCALLNSGGGILHMVNQDAQRGVVLSKHLDTWWSGMEIKMAEILSRDDICNYFDLVGNHDDKDLYLFVKSAEHLCTLQYHSRLPTDTATHEVTYQSMLQLLVSRGNPGTLEELPPLPDRYVYGHSAEELKKETKQIQFKLLTCPVNKSSDKRALPEKICSMMIKYMSAFANHEGGHIYFGIDDNRAAVVGEELDQSEQRRTEYLVTNRLINVIWGQQHIRAARGIHWDIHFFPIERLPPKVRRERVVVVVSVCKFPGGVFTHCPESYYVSSQGHVIDFSFDDWMEAILNPLRDVPELHNRFLKLSLTVPGAPLVFTLPNTVETIKQKVLLAKQGDIQPRKYIDSHSGIQHRAIIKDIIMKFQLTFSAICLGLECWGLKVPNDMCDDIICNVAMVTERDGIHVLTFSTSDLPQVHAQAQRTAALLKNKLVKLGGCTDKFSLLCHVVNISSDTSYSLSLYNRDVYPSHFFGSSSRKFNRILNSLVISMSAYRAKSQAVNSLNQHGSYYFLLTHDQFEVLWTQQFTRELWVHGPAGAGKTVAALQMIQELRRRGCEFNNILYLAENDKLCDFVRNHNLCFVTTRRALLIDAANTDLMRHKYGTVCNVLVDECQNFKDRDGDWFSLAEKLANQKAPPELALCSNYFWLFMDYSQKVHKFKAGLPSVIGKNNFMLSEVSRSTKEIFDFTSRLMMASDNVDGIQSPLETQISSTPILAHNYMSGKGVDILSCQEAEIKTLLSKVMSGLLKNGVQENDIAILVGRRSELDQVRSTLNDVSLEESREVETNNKPSRPHYMSQVSVEQHLKECGSSNNVTAAVTTAVEDKSKETTISNEVSKEKMDRCEVTATEEVDFENDDDEEEADQLELSNQFDVLSSCRSGDHLFAEPVTMETESGNQSLTSSNSKEKVTFYGYESDDSRNSRNSSIVNKNRQRTEGNPEETRDAGFAVDTVRRFSGLDKAAVIGINPSVNEEHADFNKFILSLATRARDNLVIITTSDLVKQQLDKLVA